MDTDESIFDYLAAAEETAKQLEMMTKRLPGELKAVLAEEWRKSPWLADFPKAMDAARTAAEKTENATRFLNRSVKRAGVTVCLAAVVIPLATWGWAYWQTAELRREGAEAARQIAEHAAAYEAMKTKEEAALAALRNEMAAMSASAEALRRGEGNGGATLRHRGGNKWRIVLPQTVEIDWSGRTLDGAFAIDYAAP